MGKDVEKVQKKSESGNDKDEKKSSVRHKMEYTIGPGCIEVNYVGPKPINTYLGNFTNKKSVDGPVCAAIIGMVLLGGLGWLGISALGDALLTGSFNGLFWGTAAAFVGVVCMTCMGCARAEKFKEMNIKSALDRANEVAEERISELERTVAATQQQTNAASNEVIMKFALERIQQLETQLNEKGKESNLQNSVGSVRGNKFFAVQQGQQIQADQRKNNPPRGSVGCRDDVSASTVFNKV